jgi:hypothetical protein
VTVKVITVAGDEVASVTLDSSSIFLDLKEKLEKTCGVAPGFQQLLPAGTTGSMQVLNDNSLISSLSSPATVLLVKLTERREIFKLHVRGMWSLSGIRCSLSATMETTAKEVKELVFRSANIEPRVQELDVNGASWGKTATLGEILHKAPEGEGSVTAYLFARAHPDREKLLADLNAGRISIDKVFSLDPDALMPAC